MKPRHVIIGESLLGMKEAPGRAENPMIVALAQEARKGVDWLRNDYRTEADPWCGMYVAICLKRAGLQRQKGIVGVRALSWAGYGEEIPLTVRDIPIGTIAVFGRQPASGHVGFVVGVYADGDLLILGGNQGNAVSRLKFERSRLVALRWPAGLPRAPAAPTIRGAGVISRNEA